MFSRLRPLWLLLVLIQSTSTGFPADDYYSYDSNEDYYDEDEPQEIKTFEHFVTTPRDITVVKGAHFELECLAKSSPHLVFLWRFGKEVVVVDGIVLRPDKRVLGRKISARGNVHGLNLVIKNVSEKDAGRYECQVSTPGNDKISYEVKVVDRNRPIEMQGQEQTDGGGTHGIYVDLIEAFWNTMQYLFS